MLFLVNWLVQFDFLLDFYHEETISHLPKLIKELNYFIENNNNGDFIFKSKCVKRPFMTACRRASIENFRFHDLRRTFATTLLSHNVDLKTIAKKFNVGHCTIERIVDRYKIHGLKSLEHPSKNQKYSAKFKMMVVQLVYEGRSKTSLAAEYNIPGGASTIFTWMNRYEENGYNGLISKPKGRPKKIMKSKEEKINKIKSSPLTTSEREEFEELKRQYEVLKREKEMTDMENEFLKKLDALVQKRLKREKKK